MVFSIIGYLAMLLAGAQLSHADTLEERDPQVRQVVIGLTTLLVGREDPIIYPGKASGHVHTVFGGNGFGPTMDPANALDATCTTSAYTQDLSNYWVPELWYHAKNGSFIAVQNTQNKVYYSFIQTDDEMKPFPPGLQMLAGNPANRKEPAVTQGNDGSPYLGVDPTKGHIQPVQFSCPASGGYPGGKDTGLGFPVKTTKSCNAEGTGLRYDIYFPDCYDPSTLLTDYTTGRNYSASGGGASNGAQNCPPDWVHMPAMHLEVYWDLDSFVKSGDWAPGTDEWPFVFSFGDPTGYGIHGDFVAGWDDSDTGPLANLIKNCITDFGDGGIDKCAPPADINSNEAQAACTIPASVEEPIWGWLDKLPGCNPINAGPQDVPQQTDCGAPELGKPYTQYTTVPDWTYQGCYLDLVNGVRLLDGPGLNAYVPQSDWKPVTVEYCLNNCKTQGYEYAGLEYSYQCFCGHSMNTAGAGTPNKNPGTGLPSGLCNSPCAFDQTEVCGGSNGGFSPMSVYKQGSGTNEQPGAGPGAPGGADVSGVAKPAATASAAARKRDHVKRHQHAHPHRQVESF